MGSDIRVLALDSTGAHLIRILRGETGAGSVVQVLQPGSNAGFHRTWHPNGYVHDRTTSPPSTTSTGSITPPRRATRELWAREDLRSGQLAQFSMTESRGTNVFTIDLRGPYPHQRFETWYTDPADASNLLAEIASTAQSGILSQFKDTDADRSRVLVSFVPFGA